MQKHGGGYLPVINQCVCVSIYTRMRVAYSKYEILQKKIKNTTFHLAILYEEHVKAVI